ncbi:hypothetical protein Tco_0312598 [Tanacetum coccineum]
MSVASNSFVGQATRGADVGGYKAQLKFLAHSSGVGSNEDLKFMERMHLEDMEKGTHLLLMMKETEMKIGEKIAYVSSLGDDVAV